MELRYLNLGAACSTPERGAIKTELSHPRLPPLRDSPRRWSKTIDRPLTVKTFHQAKENLIGARIAIAAYYFPHLEGSWIGEKKEKPHEHTIRVKGLNGVSCFTKEGKKIFELELSSYGVPCFAYGTVKKGNKGYYLELESVYGMSSDDPEWLADYKGDPVDTDNPFNPPVKL